MLQEFENNIGYIFKDKSLLKTALTHTSYAYEKKVSSNEKLEFLSSNFLYENYTNLNEGEMTKVRASVVCEKSLYKIATKHNFGKFLYLGKSEISNKGNKNEAILADSVEAIIAAIFIDGGLEPAKKFIISNLKEEIKLASQNVGLKDYKTVLQEKLQHGGNVNIEYNILKETGPDHNKMFEAEVKCNGKQLATGKGTSKKLAEMEAAKKAMEQI